MTDITTKEMTVSGCELHALEAGSGHDVLLLHGMKFQAATWKELGTLEKLAKIGYHAVALDMPGFGGSPACDQDQDTVLADFVRDVGLNRPVLVGPSMGGRIALEFAINHPDMVSRLVLVGPVGVEENQEHLARIRVPTLVIRGSEDQISPASSAQMLVSSVPDCQLVVFEGAPHPCYLDQPELWHSTLLDFLGNPAA
ncbi:alpha/beta fold hydrolase [Desulfolithobacter dissulfuricans]|nr:alpha/beta hydrolase [Desulfolithobacter dissulfuricans]